MVYRLPKIWLKLKILHEHNVQLEKSFYVGDFLQNIFDPTFQILTFLCKGKKNRVKKHHLLNSVAVTRSSTAVQLGTFRVNHFIQNLLEILQRVSLQITKKNSTKIYLIQPHSAKVHVTKKIQCYYISCPNIFYTHIQGRPIQKQPQISNHYIQQIFFSFAVKSFMMVAIVLLQVFANFHHFSSSSS